MVRLLRLARVNWPVVEQHTMRHVYTLPSGAQEWLCPICGRRFLTRWVPVYERLVLKEGDPDAVHVGSIGDIKINGTEQDGPHLDGPAWRFWLYQHGMTW